MVPPKPKKEKDTQHIQAFARMRPFNGQELDSHAKECVTLTEKEVVVNLPHGSKRYVFDKVFGSHSKQRDVYKSVCEPIIKEVQLGYNCTIFAYGQTGTGKTYTMVGEETGPDVNYLEDSHSGIIPRALDHLFDGLKKTEEYDFTVRVSYMEIYNEVLTDLLSIDEGKTLKIYEDSKSKGSVQIHGLEEVTVFNKKELHNILKIGSEKKNMAATALNPQSSRSHTVFTITIHGRETTPDGEELVRTGKLNLVDLAGSENINKSGAIDKRAREAGNINQSLLTLGRVIKALVDKSSHVPYRESKLTRILQDSLGGKTKTTIIATFTPASTNIDETISTLEYAFRARNITIRPEVNQKVSKTVLVQNYLEQIERLKKDLTAAQRKEGIYMNPENYNIFVTEKDKLRDELYKSVEECSGLGYRIQEMDRINEELQAVYGTKEIQLQDANDKLSKFKKGYKDLRKQRCIQQVLIDRYDDSQTEYINYSKDLSEALDKYLFEHGVLRTKVDHFYTIQNDNDKSVKVLFDSFNEQRMKMMLTMTSWTETFDYVSTSITKAMEDYIDKEDKVLDKFKDGFNSNQGSITSIANDIVSNLKSEIDRFQDFKSVHQEHVKVAAKDLIDKVINVNGNKIFKSLENIELFKFEMEQKVSENVSDLSNSLSDLMSKIKTSSMKIQQEKEDLQGKMDNAIDTLFEYSRGMLANLRSLEENNCEYAEKIERMITQQGMFLDELKSARPNASVGKMFQESKNHCVNMDDNLRDLQGLKESLCASIDNKIEADEQGILQLTQSFELTKEKTFDEISRCSQCVSQECNKINCILENAMSDFKTGTEKIFAEEEEHINELEEYLQTSKNNQELQIQRLQEANCELEIERGSLLNELQLCRSSLTVDIDTNINQLKAADVTQKSIFQDCIDKQKEDMQIYYSNFKVAPQTGQTPSREGSFVKKEMPSRVTKKTVATLFQSLEEEGVDSDNSMILPEDELTDIDSSVLETEDSEKSILEENGSEAGKKSEDDKPA